MTVHRSIPCSRSPLLRLLAIVPLFTALLAGCTEEDNPVTADDHVEPEGLLLLTAQGDTAVRYFHAALRDGDTLRAPVGGYSPGYTVTFLDSSGIAIATPSSAHTLGWSVADTGIASVTHTEGAEWAFRILGVAAGTTHITLMVLHSDHADFTTIPIPVLVGPSLLPPDRSGGRVAR
jgi:hypothetical protein